MTTSVDSLFHLGVDILKTVVSSATKAVLAQVGDVLGEVAEGDDAEWIQHVGFVSRPPKPEAKKRAAQGWGIRLRGRDVIFGSRDLRGLELAGSLGDGETAIYASGPNGTSQGRILLKGDGSVSLYTAQGNTAGGASVTIQCNADGSVVLANQYGALRIDSSALAAAFGSAGAIQFKSDGAAIIATKLAVNAGSVSLGASATEKVVLDTSLQAFIVLIKAFAAAVQAALAATPGVPAPLMATVTATNTALQVGAVVSSTSVKAAL